MPAAPKKRSRFTQRQFPNGRPRQRGFRLNARARKMKKRSHFEVYTQLPNQPSRARPIPEVPSNKRPQPSPPTRQTDAPIPHAHSARLGRAGSTRPDGPNASVLAHKSRPPALRPPAAQKTCDIPPQSVAANRVSAGALMPAGLSPRAAQSSKPAIPALKTPIDAGDSARLALTPRRTLPIISPHMLPREETGQAPFFHTRELR